MGTCRYCDQTLPRGMTATCGATECQQRANRAKVYGKRARARKKGRDQVRRDMGLMKVRGAMGGTYWE